MLYQRVENLKDLLVKSKLPSRQKFTRERRDIRLGLNPVINHAALYVNRWERMLLKR